MHPQDKIIDKALNLFSIEFVWSVGIFLGSKEWIVALMRRRKNWKTAMVDRLYQDLTSDFSSKKKNTIELRSPR